MEGEEMDPEWELDPPKLTKFPNFPFPIPLRYDDTPIPFSDLFPISDSEETSDGDTDRRSVDGKKDKESDLEPPKLTTSRSPDSIQDPLMSDVTIPIPTPISELDTISTLEETSEGEFMEEEWSVDGMKGITFYFTRFVPKQVYTPKPSLEEDSDSGCMSLLDFPKEVLEKILLELPGVSVMNLGRCSNASEAITREILSSGTLGSHFWKRRCYEELSRPMLLQVIASFFNVVAETFRTLASEFEEFQDETDIADFQDARYEYSYAEIFRTMFNFRRTLITWPVTIEDMTVLDGQIKHEVLWNFDKNKPNDPWPIRFTSTIGSVLFNIISQPIFPEDKRIFYVYEDMKTIRRSTTETTYHKEKMLGYKIMTIPLPEGVPDLDSFSAKEPLPRVWRIFVGIFEKTIYLSPVNTGIATRIHTKFYPEYFERNFKQMPTPVATLGNKIGIWTCPHSYELHTIHVDYETGNLTTEKLLEVTLRGMYNLWQYFAYEPYLYVPVMFYFFRTDPQPIFAIVSVSEGTFLFDNRLDHIDEREPVLLTSEYRLGTPIGCVTSGSTVIFWSTRTLAVGFNGWHWHLTSWHKAGIKSRVNLAEIIGPRYLMVSTNDSIVIFLMVYGTNVRGPRPTFSIHVIRHIPLGDNVKDAFIRHLHFDFDRGLPYIFIITQLNKDEDADGGKGCNFFMKKIKFWDPQRPIPGLVQEKDEEVDFPEISRSFFAVARNERLVCLLRSLRVNIPQFKPKEKIMKELI